LPAIFGSRHVRDISGFTTLTERLKKGSAGVEKLLHPE
jgi:hypothetical protein